MVVATGHRFSRPRRWLRMNRAAASALAISSAASVTHTAASASGSRWCRKESLYTSSIRDWGPTPQLDSSP